MGASIVEPWQRGGFGLYVHWPFCEAKCPYCDFNSHVVSAVDQSRWADALAGEIGRWADRTRGRVLGSIFFGGGTPSLMEPATVARVLQAARDGWDWANDIEITLEANPRSVEAQKFDSFAAAGVTRVSLGVQALDDADLRKLGRLHGVKDAMAALETARAAFDRVSVDVIYARQGQSLAAWEDELARILDLGTDHLSLYQLTIEPGTAFWERRTAGGLRGLPDEDLSADLYEASQRLCTAAGRRAYEVSNHAVPGGESRHNLVYWRGGDWVGVGPGAHGRVTLDGVRWATEAWAAPGRWLAAVEARQPADRIDALTDTDWAAEHIMMGLRIDEGLDVDAVPLASWASEAEPTLATLERDGLLWRQDTRVGTTDRGRLLLNSVAAALMPEADDHR